MFEYNGNQGDYWSYSAYNYPYIDRQQPISQPLLPAQSIIPVDPFLQRTSSEHHSSNNKNISAISRIPTSMEVWWIGASGSIKDAYWYEGSQWNQFELASAGSASPHGSITAVSRIPGSMEVWWIGANGSVQDAYWYEGSQWKQFELAPAGSASPYGSITAVSRIPGSMEV
ncbi:hypothetical protein P4185_32800, partial [Bacillus thuringiensis]|nr:hypothetical protein [Bacillus thuringiensis]